MKNYNPFKMWGSYVGAIIDKRKLLIVKAAVLISCGIAFMLFLIFGFASNWTFWQETKFTITTPVCEEKINYYFTCESGTNLVGIYGADLFDEVVLEGERCFRKESSEVICHEEESSGIEYRDKIQAKCITKETFNEADKCLREHGYYTFSNVIYKKDLTTSWLDENAECIDYNWKTIKESEGCRDAGDGKVCNEIWKEANIDECSKYKYKNYTISVK